jgi:hypothetical protein
MEDLEKAILEIKGVKRKKLNNYWLGFSIGIFAPFFFLFCYWLNSYSFMQFIPMFFLYLLKGKVLAPVISLCVIPNLGIFYLFLNSEKFKSSRGTIFATIIVGFLIMYLKIFVEETMF